MSHIQITNGIYINPRHIVSINIEDRGYTHVYGEYTNEAKFHKIEQYELTIKMSNGGVYTETFEDREKAKERRENLAAHW